LEDLLVTCFKVLLKRYKRKLQDLY
jgi:hypothetical protein